MKDYIVRATAANAQIRAFAASTTELVEEARTRHNTSPVATAALGRLLTAGAMMGSMMKNPTDVLTLQVQCGGPIGGMTVTADSKGEVKGYVHNPDVMLPPKNGKLDVGGALGPGFLNVIKDMGLKEPYSGQTILQTGEIAEDLTYYFATSEQVPSAVGLGVLMNKDNTVRQAGGFIVQLMPFAEEEVIAKLEENVSKIDSVTNLLEQGHTPESLLEKVLEGYEKGVLTRREMKMITNIFEYMDSDAKDIMTHRKNIVALDGEESLEKALTFMLEENKSRFPVYEEDIDNIVGILHIRDAMQSYLDGPARKKPVHDLKDAIRPAGFIPETKAIDKLFQQMQQDKSHMVIVLDEYGQTSGIVTMEDIVEEIVGNIQDEYDEEEELIIKQADGTYIVDGMTQLEDLEELLGISFNEEDYDTINGYLIDCLDRIPSEDEECQVEFGGYLFHVLSVDNNTIRKVLVSRTKK